MSIIVYSLIYMHNAVAFGGRGEPCMYSPVCQVLVVKASVYARTTFL